MRKLGFVSISLFATLVFACVGDDPAPTTVVAGDGGVTPGTDAGGGGDGGGGDSGQTVAPTHAPSSITFVDTDPTSGNVKGKVTIGKAADESDVTAYKLYWGSSATTRLTAITNLPVTGADVTYDLTSVVPQGATHLLAFSANAAGEMSTGVSTTPIDNFPSYTDISTGQGTNSGLSPFPVVDSVNKKLLVAVDAGDNADRLALYRCNLDGTGCTFHDASAAQGSGSAITPKAVIDTAGNKILVITRNGANSGKPALFRCDLDGTNCTYTDVSAGEGAQSAYKFSAPIIDSTNGKLLFVTQNQARSEKPWLFRCNLDGSSCTATDASGGHAGNSTGVEPTIAIAGGKLSIATADGSNNFVQALYRCNLDGTGCTFADISDGSAGSGHQPSLVIDTAAAKMLLVNYNSSTTGNGKPWLTRCGFEGNICTRVDISAGQGAGSGYYPNAVLDAVGNRLYVATQNDANNSKPALFACNSDGTSCSYADVSSGQGAASTLGAALDATNKRVLITTENAGNLSKLAFFSIGLW